MKCSKCSNQAVDNRKYCESCAKKAREYRRRWRAANPDKRREQERSYYEKNRESFRERGRAYYEKNKQRCQEKSRSWKKNNPEKAQAISKRWKEKNREKACEGARIWRKNNPEKNRKSQQEHNAKKYGLSAKQAKAIRSQRCEICGGPGGHIDHCHKTGFVRGPLCCHCNRGLGGFKDNPDLMLRASLYIRRKNIQALIKENL